jgi:hypothetical protein
VTNASGCVSQASASVAINSQPGLPAAPTVGTVTQPTTFINTGSIAFSGLPVTGNWILTRVPGGTTITGSGTNTILSLLPSGTYSYTVTNASGCVSEASASVTINARPISNAGTDQSVNEDSLVKLDGSLSSDPDNNPLTYNWTAPAGIVLSSNTVKNPEFTAPKVSTNTEYLFTLIVNDGSLNSTSDQVVITVKNINQPPVARAGIDQIINENSSYTLDGSGSTDPDNDALTYFWSAPAGITLNAGNIQKPSFTAPEVTVNTAYTFTLIVSDGILESLPDQVTITVKQENKAPIARAGLDQSVNEGTFVTLDGTASTDPDNDQLNYFWTAPKGITLSSLNSPKPTFSSPEVTHDTIFNFSLTVNDGILTSIADQVAITVRQVNKAPVANAGPDQMVAQNQTIQLDGTLSSDPDNDFLTYQWIAPAGIVLSGLNTSRPEFKSPEVNVDTDFSFKLKVTDGKLESNEDQVIVKVITYRIPVAEAGSDFSSTEGSTVYLDGSASSDPKGGTLIYHWTAPPGIVLSSNTDSKPWFKAPLVSQDTPYTFTLLVNNGVSNSISDQVTVVVKQVNLPPVANAGNDFSAYQSSLVTLNGSQSYDPDNEEISYLWTAPYGINLSSNSVMNPVFFTPNVDTDTRYTFRLTVTDGKITSLPDEVTLTVTHGNKKPVANAGNDQIVTEGTLITLDGSGSTDADNDALTYLWTAPTGITLSSLVAQKPTFTAPEVQTDHTYTFTLKVYDGKTESLSDEVQITVRTVNKTPVANAGPDQSVGIKKIVSLNGSQSYDAENDDITYLWTSPAGINLSSNTVMNPAFFTPAVDSDTDFTFKLTVSDKYHTSLPDYVVITVLGENKRPIANAGPDKAISEGISASLDGSLSTDPDNDILTYHWTAPDGITLSSTEVSKPTFIAPEVQSDQIYVFKLTVNDGKTDSYADEINVTVKQVNKAPYANAGTDQSVNGSSLCTLDGSLSFDPENDKLTYTWESPAGIVLSSATSAKPTFTTPAGSVNSQLVFTLIVNDGRLSSAADQVVIAVRQDNKAPLANAGPDQFVTQGSIVTLDGTASKDPNGDLISYRWTAPQGISLSSLTNSKPIFTAPVVTLNSSFTFSLIVSDGSLSSTSDQVVINVRQSNNAPVFTSARTYKVHQDEPFSFILEGSDPENDPLSFSISQLPSFLKLNKSTSKSAILSGIFGSQNLGNNTYKLTLTDGNLTTDELITIEVSKADAAPYVKDSIPNITTEKGSSDKVIDLRTVFADDDPGDELSYQVELNTGINFVTAKIIGSYLILSISEKNTGISELLIRATSNGKVARSNFKVEVQIPTGIDPGIADSDVRIYPNPATEKVYVKFSRQPKAGTWIILYNSAGKMISRKPAMHQEEVIKLKNLVPGLYLIKTDQSASGTFKLVID